MENIEDKALKKFSVLPIGMAVKLAGVSAQTLRAYERYGLVMPARSNKKQRLYSFEDIERIKEIRVSLKMNKIGIMALRSMISMIPCWSIKDCSESDRENCAVFTEDLAPCWTYKHQDNVCADMSCRDCEVYKLNSNFIKARETIITELQKGNK